MTRFAVVYGPSDIVGSYLPWNYAVVGEAYESHGEECVISGVDTAGWTLDGYVIPRLASGLYPCTELSANQED